MTQLDAIEIDRDWLAAHPLPRPAADTDKNKRGRVLVAGGSASVPGALRLTGVAALRAGAGKLQLATVAGAAPGLGLAMPEAAVFPLPANAEGELSAEAGSALAPLLERCDALALGPGIGAKAEAAAILEAVLAAAGPDLAILIDAGAIGDSTALAQAIRGHAGHIVFTPHPGEMALLAGCSEAEVALDHARAAADRFAATLVLKSSETWIATPGEPMLHYSGGGPGLATGGSGDVLAGIIAGLLARGTDPHVAAAWGVHLHGEAGRILAARIGPLGFLARELLPEIPSLMAART
ncbi:MAG: NAD(P)H-hydrate dehydratase [Pseudomonadota bacterium]